MARLAPARAVPSALLALAVLRAPAGACLLCFTTFAERLRICQMFAGVDSPELRKCEEVFTAAFRGLSDMEINYEERSHLHDAFTQMTLSLQEMAAAQGSFEVAFPDAAEKIRKVIMQLKEAQACIPPCGLQEVSRRFRCRGCYSSVCDLPLDCPVQDVTVARGDQAMFSCVVNFQLPEKEITYSWKFAGGAPDSGRVLLPGDAAGPRIPGAHPAGAAPPPRHLLLRDPARPAPPGAPLLLPQRCGRACARARLPGPRSCPADVRAPAVTGPPPRGETELQLQFREVLRWAGRDEDAGAGEAWRPSWGELLASPEALTPGNLLLLAAVAALASASATLWAWMFFQWYFSGN
ncbi:sperm acrosome membrane-associated protein 6 isoform X1 [Microcebus murinus]|uniref:sperm acrosome membrane-associated protein 6 isoform X1 n=1 Tax=Microcebus murinus TaxID=30608 RepID=UPI003F6A9C89